MEITMVQFGSDTLVVRAPFIEVIVKKFTEFLTFGGKLHPHFKPVRFEEEEVPREYEN